MMIIPAVDLQGGKAVRLLQGDPSLETVFSHDPVQTALRWFNEGAERVHVVDLDGSFAGAPRNRALVEEIVREIPIPVQLGGGIRDLQTAGAYLDAGVERVIFGTMAVENPEVVGEACRLWPGSVAVAIDARGGRVTVRGWTQPSGLEAAELAKRFEGMGVSVIIYTDVERDGMSRGLNLEATRALAGSVSIPVIASGGVASLQDIAALMKVVREGIEGVIVGRALYAGAFELGDALRLVRGEA
jgi:phosphoribosylformimino-5-aminoimidazole carboxamide ribotide isomerase